MPARLDRFDAASHDRGRGSAAEDAAVSWLERHGYELVERNWTVKTGEIDAVALDGDTLCFVEIKARSGRGFGPAVASVTRAKARRIGRLAALYLVGHDWDGPCRFDVLGLDREEAGGWRFTLIRDAFRIDG